MSRLKHHQGKPLLAAAAVNVRFAVLFMASLALMTLDQRYHNLERVRDVLATALYPLQYAVQLPSRSFEWVSRELTTHTDLLEENERLQRKTFLLNAQLQKLAALEAENRRLRMLLGSSVNLGEKVLIAELLAVDFDPYRHQILLDKGKHQGVHAGQPLLDQRGVFGQVIHANTLTATAILITDPNHALPVQVNRNGLRTLALGTGDFQRLELPHIPHNADIRVGDLLVTSGLGRRFPQGYPVGEITSIEFDPSHPFARVNARPLAELDRSREVLLVIRDPAPPADSLNVGPYKAP